MATTGFAGFGAGGGKKGTAENGNKNPFGAGVKSGEEKQQGAKNTFAFGNSGSKEGKSSETSSTADSNPFGTSSAKKTEGSDSKAAGSNPFQTGTSFVEGAQALKSKSSEAGNTTELKVLKEGTNAQGNRYFNFSNKDFMYLNKKSSTIYLSDKEDGEDFILRDVKGAIDLQIKTVKLVTKKEGNTVAVSFTNGDTAYFNRSDNTCRYVKSEDMGVPVKKSSTPAVAPSSFGQSKAVEGPSAGFPSKGAAVPDSRVGLSSSSSAPKKLVTSLPSNPSSKTTGELVVKKEGLNNSPSPSRVRDVAARPDETYAKAMKRRHQSNVKTLALLSDANTMRRNYDSLLLWDYYLQQREETLVTVEKMLQDAEGSLKLSQQKNHELMAEHPILNPGTAAQAAMDSETRNMWEGKGSEFFSVLQQHAGRLQQLEGKLKKLGTA